METAVTAPSDLPAVLDPASERYLRYARTGDRAALEAALTPYLDRAYTQARRFLGDGDEAADAVQEAVLQLMRTAGSYDGSVPFGARLARLVHIACLRLIRSKVRWRRRDPSADVVEPPRGDDEEIGATVRSAVTELPERDRAAIDLHYFAGLPQREAASALGMSENAFAVRVHRARERLRAILARRGVAATATAVVTALASAPAHAAPSVVVASVGTLLSTGVAALPATTIPIGAARRLAEVVVAHPLLLAFVTMMVVAAGALAALAALGEDARPEAEPVPAPKAEARFWRGPAKELLPYIDPSQPIAAAIDLDAFRELGVAAEPGGLFADPLMAPVMAHIREQLEALVVYEPEVPPIWRGLASARGAVAWSGSQAMHAFIADVGDGDAEARRWSELALRANWADEHHVSPEATRAGFRGWQVGTTTGIPDVLFLGFSGSRVALASRGGLDDAARRVRLEPEPPSAWLEAPLRARIDLSPVVRVADQLDRDRSDPLGLGRWLPGWRTSTPGVVVSAAPLGTSWSFRSTLTGCADLPLRPLAPTYAGLIDDQTLAAIGVALDRMALPRLLGAIIGDERRAGKLTSAWFGGGPEALAELFTGDLVITAHAAAPFPQVTVVLGIRDAQRMEAVVVKAMEALRGRAGAEPRRWTAPSPAGVISVALGRDRLVLTTADGRLAAALRPAVGATEGPALLATADLATLARTWLPLAYAQLQPELMLGSDRTLVSSMAGAAMHMALNLKQDFAGDRTSRLSTIMRRTWSKDPRIDSGNLLRGLTGVLDEIVDTCFAYYSDARWSPEGHYEQGRQSYVVYRSPRGFHLSSWPYQRSSDWLRPLDAAELAPRLQGLAHVIGPEPEKLAVLPLSTEPPIFDQRWLPPVEALARHLPRYRLAATATADGLDVHEEVLPLAALSAAFGAITALQTTRYSLPRAIYLAIDRRHAAAVRDRHLPEIEVLKRVSALTWNREAQPFAGRPASPSAPSGLVAEGSMTYGEFAPLFAGRTPTAAELDALGTWQQASAFARWRVPLEDGWYAYVNTLGVIITSDPDHAWMEKPIRIEVTPDASAPSAPVRDAPPAAPEPLSDF